MAFTMHSHSGQFCPGHAKDQLEAVIQHAISLGYTHIGLTEHMPRILPRDLYPEEIEAELPPSSSSSSSTPPSTSELETAQTLALSRHHPLHQSYLCEAVRLRDLYSDKLKILIAFEADFLRPTDYPGLIGSLASDPRVDYFIGSLHHVKEVPIDYSPELYAKAVSACRSSSSEEEEREEKQDDPDAALASTYYDEHLAMLQALRPRIVGHFDLHRLLARDPNLSSHPDYPYPYPSSSPSPSSWSSVHAKALRNLEFVRSYGGILECNTAALRKGLAEPYPARHVAKAWVDMGGKFTLSDDSHGIAQVGTNYARGLRYLEGLGVGGVWVLEKSGGGEGEGKVVEKEVKIEDIKKVVEKW